MAVGQGLPPPGARLAFASHRLLPLDGDDVAVLADRSTGWAIVRTDEYRTLRAYLESDTRTLDLASKPDVQVLSQLWGTGLLTADGRPNPDTVRVPEPYPTSLLLKLTGACNLACTYCYDYEPTRFRARLDVERIKEVVTELLDKQTRIALVFHGGEPLLRFDLIKETVAFAEASAGRGKRVGFAIQTNATRFSPEVVQFLDDHDFSVGISLDGADEASNALRVVHHGPTPLEGVRRLLADYPTFVRERCGFLAVVSRTSAPKLPAFATWLQDMGVSSFSISFLDLTGRGAGLAHERLSPDEAVEVYRSLVDMIRRGELETLAWRSLTSRIHNLFTFQPRDLCHKGPCGAANEFLVLDAEGATRTCDCIYDPFFELGSPATGIPLNALAKPRLRVIERHDWLRDDGPVCATCPLFGLCGGTCVAKAIASNGTPNSVDAVECAVVRYIYPELLRELARGADTPLINYYRRHEATAPRFEPQGSVVQLS